jgi:hypothetical protein
MRRFALILLCLTCVAAWDEMFGSIINLVKCGDVECGKDNTAVPSFKYDLYNVTNQDALEFYFASNLYCPKNFCLDWGVDEAQTMWFVCELGDMFSYPKLPTNAKMDAQILKRDGWGINPCIDLASVNVEA